MVSVSNTNFRSCPRRRGTVYVAVLGVALIVSVIAAASMQIARLETRSAVTDEELVRARLLAQSAIAFALGRIDLDSNWRTNYTEGAEVPDNNWINLASTGKLKFALLDSDGDLADDTSDMVTIKGIGQAGDTTSVVTVTLEAYGTGLNSLELAFLTGGDFVFNGGVANFNQAIGSGNNLNNSGATLNANVEAVGAVNGTVNGTIQTSATPREMPDATTLFDYYIANGTSIDVNALPGFIMDRIVLSPNSNPFGPTNALGIYVIDCQGHLVIIRDSRLLATLVLLNPHPNSKIDKDIHWEPAIENFPALLVQGSFVFDWHGEHDLRESQFGINYNPVGTPYDAVEDLDAVDIYPGVIKGLVYIAGDLHVSHQCVLDGVVIVGGSCTVDQNIDQTYQSTFFDNPPPGFSSGTEVRILPGTWQQTAY